MNDSGNTPLHPEDLNALQTFARAQEWLRAVLCTVARRGVAFRRAHPERARALLDALQPSPLFKAGQFLFDLMEWEDFMVDGTPPPVLTTTLDASALQRLARMLHELRAHLDGAAASLPANWQQSGVTAIVPRPDDAQLPALEPGFYLYEDVVLGIIRSAPPTSS